MADTSAIFALFDAADARHAAARAAFASAEPILVPHEILVEAVGLLERRHGFAAAVQAGQRLRGLPNVEVQHTPDDVWEDLQAGAWKAFVEAQGAVSHADAVVVAWCHRRRLKPLAFDRALVRIAAR